MIYESNIGTVHLDLVQASDYAAGSSRSLSASVDVIARRTNEKPAEVVGRSHLEMEGVELYENIPESFVKDMEYALDQFLEVSFDPETYHMGQYGILHETGDRILPSHRYGIVFYISGSPADPEFRFVPVRSHSREECRIDLAGDRG